jgi:hypothetical protein
MNRPRRLSVVCFVSLVAAGATAADAQPPAKGGEKWQIDRAMTVTPAAEPQPALRYRLLPMAPDLKEGNAVPIYLRLAHEQNDAARKHWTETPQKLNEAPLDPEHLAEARKFLGEIQGRFLTQLDYGARRRTAEWDYTIEQPDPISILLPDLQSMRNYAPMMVLRARVQIAAGDFAAAARSFQTGFAFARHVGEEGPFLIGGLVGLAIANMHAERIPEWIERPGSPNLYWSLTALPRPLISFRRQLEFEQRVIEWQFPDLADLDRPRPAAEWDAALKRYRAEVRRIEGIFKVTNESKSDPQLPPAADPDEPAAKSPDLVAARMYVTTRTGKSADDVAAMPPAQVLLLYIHGTAADARDELFKLTYLPFPEAAARLPEAARGERGLGGEGGRLSRLFLPAIQKVLINQVRLDRRIAMLRAVEALRLHAAAHGGQLPDSLDQVTEAPVPLDPGTGNAIEYHRDGATATLLSRLPSESTEQTGIRYRVTIRK